jgi:hypothetical protein
MYPRGGNPLAFDHRGIAEEMRKSLYLMFNAHVVIYDPHLDAPKEKYDYKKDSGGVGQPEIVFDSGAAGALIHTLSSTDMPEVGGQTSGSTGIRLQVKEKVPRPVLRSGLIVKVVDGGQNSALTKYLYRLTEALDQSDGWHGIWTAELVTGGVGDWNYEASGYGVTPYGVGRYGD